MFTLTETGRPETNTLLPNEAGAYAKESGGRGGGGQPPKASSQETPLLE